MILGDTIVAVSSPLGSGWRGIVRLSGPQARVIAAHLFEIAPERQPGVSTTKPGPAVGEVLMAVPAARDWREGRLCLGEERLPATMCVFPAPHSYTREDVVEFHTLGAPGVLGLLIESCLSRGARRAEAGEFTARAYLAGAYDLSQVHAVAGMIAARSDQQLRAAERLLHGALGRVARMAREALADLVAHVEAALDFADEPLEFITRHELLERLSAVRHTLLATSAAGLRAERWGRLPRVLLAGPPNVGKSSIMNMLTGLNRAICSPVAGTTRDVLSAPLVVGDRECLLLDIAGLEEGGGELSRLAQEAAREALAEADLILSVVDVTRPRAAALARDGVPIVFVLNKCDLLSPTALKPVVDAAGIPPAAPRCQVSAATRQGHADLLSAIAKGLADHPTDAPEAAIALMAEHRDALERAIAALERALALAEKGGVYIEHGELVAAELHAATSALGLLVGEEQTEEMLGRIFSRFCIGK